MALGPAGCCGLLAHKMGLLLVVHEPYTEYNRGGSVLTWLLGPATVALAVPMYRHGMALRKSVPKLLLIVLAGKVVGMASAGFTAWSLGAPWPVVMSAVPKSVTTPIAIQVCRELKGIPQITIAMVILAGVLGSSLQCRYCDLWVCRVTSLSGPLWAPRRTALALQVWFGIQRCRLWFPHGQWLRRERLHPCWRHSWNSFCAELRSRDMGYMGRASVFSS